MSVRWSARAPAVARSMRESRRGGRPRRRRGALPGGSYPGAGRRCPGFEHRPPQRRRLAPGVPLEPLSALTCRTAAVPVRRRNRGAPTRRSAGGVVRVEPVAEAIAAVASVILRRSCARTEPAQSQERFGPARRFCGPWDWQSAGPRPAGQGGAGGARASDGDVVTVRRCATGRPPQSGPIDYRCARGRSCFPTGASPTH